MKIVGVKMNLDQFRQYARKKNFGSLPPDRLVIHHTWKPTLADWKGADSIQGLKSYFEGLGWEAGPHIIVAEDGIWLFTDMYDIGIHAGKGNATWKHKTTGKVWQGWGKDFNTYELLSYSVGIEVVGDYDNKLWSGQVKENAIGTIKILMDRLNLDLDSIKFHRDYSSKSCPGRAITKEWLFEQLREVTVLPTTPPTQLGMIDELIGECEKITGSNYGKMDTKELQEKAAKDLRKHRFEFESVQTDLKMLESLKKKIADIKNIVNS